MAIVNTKGIIGKGEGVKLDFDYLRTNKTPFNFKDKFTENQWQVYQLIHPQGANMLPKEAAKELEINISTVNQIIQRMRKRVPEAFMYEKVDKRVIGEGTKEVSNIYAGYKQAAEKSNLPFELTEGDLEEIIKLECSVCGRDGDFFATNWNKGSKFKATKIKLTDISLGYIYWNCIPICTKCQNRG